MILQRALLIGVFITGSLTSCGLLNKGQLLAAPSDANPTAERHNAEGIQAHAQGQLELARQHFEEAVKVSPMLAEGHYNLGMVLYQLGREGEGRPHFMKAANLAPGNSVIWSSPPLSGVSMPTSTYNSGGGASDGHGHSH